MGFEELSALSPESHRNPKGTRACRRTSPLVVVALQFGNHFRKGLTNPLLGITKWRDLSPTGSVGMSYHQAIRPQFTSSERTKAFARGTLGCG